MNPLLALELRKNRLTLIGLAAAFVLVPPLSLLVARHDGLDPALTLQAGVWWWVLAGLPLSAAFIAASAGAGLRAPAAREAEDALSQSPSGRVLRGFAGAALQFLLLASVTMLLCSLLSPGWSKAVFDGPVDPKAWAGAVQARAFVAFLVFDLMASCFLCAYAVGHAFAGGLLGAAVLFAEFAALANGFIFSDIFPERLDSFAVLAALAALAGLAAKAAAVKPLSARFERARPLGFARAAAAAVLVCAGAFASWGMEESAYARLRSSLRLVKPEVSSLFLSIGTSPEEVAAALNPGVRSAGALATTFAGGLFWISPAGKTARLLPDDDTGRFSVVNERGTRVESAAWDESGRLLVTRRIAEPSGDKSETWIGRPAEGLKPVSAEGGNVTGVMRQDGRVGVGVEKDYREFFCGVGDDARARACAPSRNGFSEDGAPKGMTATLSRDGLSISRGGPRPRTWRLPGRAMDADVKPFHLHAYLVGGKPAYFALVRIKDDEAVAACFDDGKVKTVWRHSWSGLGMIGGLTPDVLPDGTLVYQYAYDWNVVDPAGNFLPPIRSKRLFERWPRPGDAPPHTPRLVHRAGGRAWIFFEADRLVEMDESSGMPIKDWPLPVRIANDESPDEFRVLEGGIILQGRGIPFFVGWDGAARGLRAP